MFRLFRSTSALLTVAIASAVLGQAPAQTAPMTPDIPAKFAARDGL